LFFGVNSNLNLWYNAAMKTESELKDLNQEISDMMGEYNARKIKLIEIIDTHGAKAGDFIVTPDEYDHLFEEAAELLEKIEERLNYAASVCPDYLQRRDSLSLIGIAQDSLSGHKDFFDHIREMQAIRDKPSTLQ
jgi:hypothetical protein